MDNVSLCERLAQAHWIHFLKIWLQSGSKTRSANSASNPRKLRNRWVNELRSQGVTELLSSVQHRSGHVAELCVVLCLCSIFWEVPGLAMTRGPWLLILLSDLGNETSSTTLSKPKLAHTSVPPQNRHAPIYKCLEFRHRLDTVLFC